MIFIMEFIKGHNYVNNVGEFTVRVFCKSSYHDFIFVPSFVKISQRVSELLSRQNFGTETYKWHNFL